MKKKYGATLDDVAPKPAVAPGVAPAATTGNNIDTNMPPVGDPYWDLIKQALQDFYAKHDPFKDQKEIDGVFQWTQRHGLNELNGRLVKKYNETIAVTMKQPTFTSIRVKDLPVGAGAGTAAVGAGVGIVTSTPPPQPVVQPPPVMVTTPPPAVAAATSTDSPKNKTPPKLPERKSGAKEQAAEQASAPSGAVDNGNGIPPPPPELFQHFGPYMVKEQSQANDFEKVINDMLVLFFQKYDPDKPKKDIDFLAGFAMRRGVDTVNNQLKLNFGVGLEDVGWTPHTQQDFEMLSAAAKPTKPMVQESTKVTPSAPAPAPAPAVVASPPPPAPVIEKTLSPEEELKVRREEIANKLRIFYKKHDPSRLEPSNIEQFNKVVTYGLEKGLVRLNGALREKFNEDLDDVQKAYFRQSLAPFFQKNQPEFSEFSLFICDLVFAFMLLLIMMKQTHRS